MKIVILTQYYPPDKPGRIPEDIATEMSNRGHDVKVLTAFPHRTGKIAEGYKQRINHVEKHGPILVRRVPIYPSISSNPIARAANYLSFAFSARLAKDFVRDADVIYVHGTPATPSAPARIWSKSLGIPFVFHVQDIWPESVTGSGFLPKPLVSLTGALINRWLTKVYTSAAAVNAIAPTAQDLLIQRGVPKDRCHLVYNWSKDADEVMERPQCEGPGLTLLYAGNLGPLQDLETVIRAAQKLNKPEGFRLLIAGSGVYEDRLKKLVTELNAQDTIQFLGQVQREQMPSLYAQADFQIVSLKDLDIFAGTIPSKFQAGLGQGIPVITTVKGDVTRLVNENNLGFSAPPEDVDSLAAAFLQAYRTTAEERSDFSRRAKAFHDSHFTRTKAMDHIESILQHVVESSTVATK